MSDTAEQGGKFCFVIGLPRSGTTVFKELLQTHPQIFNMGEIFSEPNGRSYFHFLQRQMASDPDVIFPSRSENNFVNYLEWCSEQALRHQPGNKIVIMDVKYDQAHLLADPWRSLGSLPKIFSMMRERSWRVIDIHRNDVLGQVVSNHVAMQTKIYHSTELTEGAKRAAKVRIDPKQLRRELNKAINAYQSMSQHFRDYDGYLMLSYEEMFDADDDGNFSSSITDRLSAFLQVEDKFDRKPKLAKLLTGDVFSHIENDDEIRELMDKWNRNRKL